MDIKVFTIKEYLKARRLCLNIFPKLCLAEEKTKYNVSEEEREKDVVHKEHDKLFKKILERPEEAENRRRGKVRIRVRKK